MADAGRSVFDGHQRDEKYFGHRVLHMDDDARDGRRRAGMAQQQRNQFRLVRRRQRNHDAIREAFR